MEPKLKSNPIDQFYSTSEVLISDISEYITGHTHSRKLIEAGAGEGQLTQELLLKGFDITAVELDPLNLDRLTLLPRSDHRLQIAGVELPEFIQKSAHKNPKFLLYICGTIPDSTSQAFFYTLFTTNVVKELYIVVSETTKTKWLESHLGTAFYQIIHQNIVPNESLKNAVSERYYFVHAELNTHENHPSLSEFLRRWVYQHQDTVLKNTITKALDYYVLMHTQELKTKNELREITKKIFQGKEELLLKTASELPEIYELLIDVIDTIL